MKTTVKEMIEALSKMPQDANFEIIVTKSTKKQHIAIKSPSNQRADACSPGVDKVLLTMLNGSDVRLSVSIG